MKQSTNSEFVGYTIHTNFRTHIGLDYIGAIGKVKVLEICNKNNLKAYNYNGYLIRYGNLIFTTDGWCARYK